MRVTDRRRQLGRITLPLALRLFLGMVLLIAFAVGAAVFVTYVQGRQIAQHAVDKALATSTAVQREFEQRRLDQLQLAVRQIAADANFIKYIADASGFGGLPGLGGEDDAPDTGSMRDLLVERQTAFDLDLGILLDADGNLLARTDELESFAASMADDPLVEPALREGMPISGYWRQGDQLFQAAIMPLARDQDLVGFLIVALTVSDQLSQAVAKVSSAEIAFFLPEKDDIVLIASSLAPAAASELSGLVTQRRAEFLPAVQNGTEIDHVPMHFSGQEWSARLVPAAAPGEGRLGSVAIMSSTEQITSSYRDILNRVVLAGLISIGIAILLSILLARRILRPIGTMAEAAEAAAAGDYQTHIGSEGNDALGRLASAFDSLLSDLREKKDIEGYVGQMARFLPEPAAEAVAAPVPASPRMPPQHEELALLEVEFRHLLATVDAQSDPVQRARAHAGVHDLLDAIAAGLDIEVRAMDGARWRLACAGATRLQTAVKAWATILRDCSQLGLPAPAGALTDGSIVRALGMSGRPNQSIALGTPVAHADRLLCDAAAGQLLFTRASGDVLKQTLPEGSLSVVIGGFSGKKYYALSTTSLPALVTMTRSTVVQPASTPTLTSPVHKPSVSGSIANGSILGGRYRIISQLGEGGMGVVYKAHDLELDDIVALKMLRSGLLVDTEQVERLKSEIKLARRITHPNVLRTFDFSEVDGRPCISMEYVRGLTLRYLLSEAKRVPYSAALRIARQLAAGLAAAHEVGVLHRDIKPENLILEANGNAKLMDFGIARPLRRSTPGQTQAGTFVGTPDYCPPEQLSGGDIDERADIYACGVLMSEMFCGGMPYVGGNTMDIYQAQINDAPRRPSELWPEIPPDLEALILRCVRSAREERFASATDLGEALSHLRS
ncbi:protein kinase [Dokdonella sp.]|uniref:serine/threonine-protein kinase n=1 Tax=Dokdonella sp. TaxID=2291710 RepID=UPI0035282D1D